MNTIINEVGKYLSNLTATNPICSSLGVTLTFGSNLHLWLEPPEATQLVTVIPYGGSPSTTVDKQNSYLQIRVKAKTNKRCGETTQAIINTFDRNGNICASTNGVVLANQSAPIFLPAQAGGKWPISVSNYTIKHVKIT